MGLESRHQKYLQQLGIETWRPRVDASFFPEAPCNDSQSLIDQTVNEPDLRAATGMGAHAGKDELMEQDPVVQGTPTSKRYNLLEFSGGCIVLVETDETHDALSRQHKRLLSGILRALGISNLSASAPALMEGVSEIHSTLKEKKSMLLLCFGEVNGAEFPDYKGSLLCFDPLQTITNSADAKRHLWTRLKQWNISSSSTG